MPQLPFNLRSLLMPPGTRPSPPLREPFDSPSLYRRSNPPLGLLSQELWSEPDTHRQLVSYRLQPDLLTRQDQSSRSDVRLFPAADMGTQVVGPAATSADATRGETARQIHRKENRWPLLVREAERRKSILGNSAGLFDVADNPDADADTPWYSFHRDGYNGVKRHDARIEQEAKRLGVDPDLARAIMYVEYANGYGYGGPAQFAGLAGSLYPMNIRPDIWQSLAGANADFNDSDVNVRAGVSLLKRIRDRLTDPSVAKIATLYNSLAKDRVTDYGAQVERAYRDKLWAAPTLP